MRIHGIHFRTYPEQSFNQKIFVVQVFVLQNDKDSGLSAIYGNADPDPGEPNQCGSSSASVTSIN
jgi:hypothetical protein